MLKVPALGSLAGRRTLCLTPKPGSHAELLMRQKPPALDRRWAVDERRNSGHPPAVRFERQGESLDVEKQLEKESDQRRPPQPITTDGSQMDDVLHMGRGNSRS